MDPHPLSPDVWGRSAWSFLHASTFSYPENPTPEQCTSALQFYENLGNMLPCPRCRGHYNSNIRRNPPKVQSREDLSRWLVDIHNEVRKAQGKSTIEYDVAKRHYLLHSKELSCDSVYVNMLKKKIQQKDMTIVMLTLAIGIVAVLLVAAARKRASSGLAATSSS